MVGFRGLTAMEVASGQTPAARPPTAAERAIATREKRDGVWTQLYHRALALRAQGDAEGAAQLYRQLAEELDAAAAATAAAAAAGAGVAGGAAAGGGGVARAGRRAKVVRRHSTGPGEKPTPDPRRKPKAVSTAARLRYLALKNLGEVHLERSEWDQAARLLSRALGVDATDVLVWKRLADAAAQLQRWDLARCALESGLATRPSHWPSLQLLCDVLWTLDDALACAVALREALAVDPRFSRGRAMLAALDGGSGCRVAAGPAAQKRRRVGAAAAPAAAQPVTLRAAAPAWADVCGCVLAECSRALAAGGFRAEVTIDLAAPSEQHDDPMPVASSSQSPQPVQATPAPAAAAPAPLVEQTPASSPAATPSSTPAEGAPTSTNARRISGRAVEAPRRFDSSENGTPVAAEPIMPTKQIAEELAGFMDPLPATSAPAAAPATPGAPVAASSPYDERMRVTEYVEGGAKEGILGVTRALLEHVCAERPPSTTDLRLRVLELFRFAYSPRGVAASGKPASKAVTAPRISEPLCPTALLFVAELCWQEHLAAATSSTTTSESQLCKSILSEMSFRGSERLHEDWRESLMARARESWLRAHLAESEAALAASESHLHRCELLIQELGGALRVDCAGDTPITSRSIAAKRAGLQARRALEQTGNLMQLGKFAECAEALAPFLSSGTESKKMRGPVTLNRALEAALRSDRFDVALACQEYRLQTALSSSGKLKRTKLSYNPEWAANCSSPESAPPTRRTLMQQEVAVLALILRNLSDPPRSFEETLGPRLQRLVLECLERLSGGQLEDAAAQCAAVQCWECFLRVWAMLNEPQEQTMLPLASLALNICVQKGIHRADDGLAIRFCVQALHYSGAAAPAQPAAIMLDDTAETADFSSAASWREFAGTVLFHLYGVRLSSLSQLKRSKSDLDGQVGLTQHEGLLWLKWAQPQLIPSQMTNFEQAQWAAFVTRLWSLFNAPPSTIAKYAAVFAAAAAAAPIGCAAAAYCPVAADTRTLCPAY